MDTASVLLSTKSAVPHNTAFGTNKMATLC